MITTNVSTVTWRAPSQPNGIITGYEVIYYELQEQELQQKLQSVELGRSGLLSSTSTEYLIANLGKQ